MLYDLQPGTHCGEGDRNMKHVGKSTTVTGVWQTKHPRQKGGPPRLWKQTCSTINTTKLYLLLDSSLFLTIILVCNWLVLQPYGKFILRHQVFILGVTICTMAEHSFSDWDALVLALHKLQASQFVLSKLSLLHVRCKLDFNLCVYTEGNVKGVCCICT